MGFIRENILKIFTMIIIFIVIIVVCIFAFGGKNQKNSSSYSSMEQNLVIVVKKYLNDNAKLIPKNNGEITKVNLDILVNSEYINELHSIEDENVKCSGYIQVVNKNNNYSYIPYIKCGNYYETKKISDYIKDNSPTVIDEDGLYKIANKYVFRGENPNNYLRMGERLYRIIEITEEDELKLISTEKTNNHIVWDDRYNVDRDRDEGINDFSKSRLKDSLEEIYNSVGFFSEQEKAKIIEHNICIGKRYRNDVSIDGSSECSVEYPNQYVSLLQLNEYPRASIDQNCKTINDKACANYNYLENISSLTRTITAVADNTYQVYYVSNGKTNVIKASGSFNIYPVIYIDKLSIYESGDGSIENPYIIK